jgi:hypothetical protein
MLEGRVRAEGGCDEPSKQQTVGSPVARASDDDVRIAGQDAVHVVPAYERQIGVDDERGRARASQGGGDGTVESGFLVDPDLDAGGHIDWGRAQNDHGEPGAQRDRSDVIEELSHQADAIAG